MRRGLLSLLLCLLPALADAAITYDTTSSVAIGTSVSSLTWSHTTAAGTDRLLGVCVHLRDGGENRTVTAVTYAGVALTRAVTVAQLPGDGTFARSELWYVVAPATGANNIVVTYSGSLLYLAAASAITLQGVDQASPLGATNSNLGAFGGASVSVTSTVANSMLQDCMFDSGGIASPTPGAGQTVRETQTGGAGADTVTMSTKPTTTLGSYTLSWSDEAGVWMTAVAEWKPSSGGGGGGSGCGAIGGGSATSLSESWDCANSASGDGDLDWTEIASPWAISNHTAVAVGTVGSYFNAYTTTALTTASQRVQATLSTWTVGTNIALAGVTCQKAASSEDFYYSFYAISGSGGATVSWVLNKHANGSTDLVTVAVGGAIPTPTVGQVLRLDCVWNGSTTMTLTGYVNGSQIATYADSSIPISANRQIGILGYITSATGVVGLDTWSALDIPGGPPPPPSCAGASGGSATSLTESWNCANSSNVDGDLDWTDFGFVNWAISGNAAYAPGSLGNYLGAYATTALTTASQRVQTTLSTWTIGTGTALGGPVCQKAASAADTYYGWWPVAEGGGSVLYWGLGKHLAGVASFVATIPVGGAVPTPTVGQVLRLDCQWNSSTATMTLSGYVDGSLVLTVNDTSSPISTNRQVGILAFITTATGVVGLDTWSAMDIAVGTSRSLMLLGVGP